MRAWHLTAPGGRYEWGEVPDPVPGELDVRVAVRASALNHMDLWLLEGRPRPPAFPHVPGCDVVGVVERVGARVTAWAPGDEVVVNPAVVPVAALAAGEDAVLDRGMQIVGEQRWGGHGELVVVPEHSLVRRPPGRSWTDLAAYPVCLLSAWRLLRRARVGDGDRVLVTGIGSGVGTATLVLATHLGAEVTVTSRDPDKREAALAFGAAAAVDSAGPYPEGMDVVVDAVGPAVWEQAMRSLRRGGRLCVCGGTSGPVVELHLPTLFWRQLEIIGASMGSPDEFAHVTGLMSDGLPAVVDQVLPLEDYPAALERLRTGQQLGKVVLEHPA